jgi:hypothetical protein
MAVGLTLKLLDVLAAKDHLEGNIVLSRINRIGRKMAMKDGLFAKVLDHPR